MRVRSIFSQTWAINEKTTKIHTPVRKKTELIKVTGSQDMILLQILHIFNSLENTLVYTESSHV